MQEIRANAWVVDKAFKSFEFILKQDETRIHYFGARVARHELLSLYMRDQYVDACSRDAHRPASAAAPKTQLLDKAPSQGST